MGVGRGVEQVQANSPRVALAWLPAREQPALCDTLEQKKTEKDCGVRALVALCIAKECGLQCYMEL